MQTKPRLKAEALERLQEDVTVNKPTIISNLLVLVTSFIFTLLLAEIALRLVPIPIVERLTNQQNVQKQIDEVHPKGLYTINPQSGWTLTPSFSGRFKKNDFDILVEANSEGIRNSKVEKKSPGQYRILGIGDSFAFGWGVENQEGFLKKLEQLLSRNPQLMGKDIKSVEVINAGIPGYGTYEANQLMQHLAPIYQPDLVLLAMYEGNDYLNNAQAPRARIIKDGYLKDVTRQRSPLLTSLLNYSVVASLIDVAITRIIKKAQFNGSLDTTRILLGEIASYTKEHNSKFAIILIPDQDKAFYNRSDLLRTYDKLVAGGDLYTARKVIGSYANNESIPFYILSSNFENSEQSSTLRLEDTHFNEAGHRAASIEIYKFMKESVL